MARIRTESADVMRQFLDVGPAGCRDAIDRNADLVRVGMNLDLGRAEAECVYRRSELAGRPRL